MAGKRGFGSIIKERSGRYRARYADPRGRTRVSQSGKPTAVLHTAPNTFDTREDAEAWLTDERRMISAGTWTPPADRHLPDDDAPSPTLREFSSRWLAERTRRDGDPLKPRTRAHYRDLLDRFILPTLGETTVAELNAGHVRAWWSAMDPHRKTQRQHSYILLRSIMASAADPDEYDLRPDNPVRVKQAEKSRPPRLKRIRPATVAELEAITAEMPVRYQPMVMLSSWCALRFGEVTELRRKDVDLTRGVVKVRRGVVRADGQVIVGTTKSDAGAREVTIPPHKVPMLRAHLEAMESKSGDALLFPARDGVSHMAPSSLYRVYYRARVAAGRPDLRWHDLRHSGLVLAAQTGATLAELMERGGHSTNTAAMRYQHAADGRAAQIAASMSQLAEAPKPKQKATKNKAAKKKVKGRKAKRDTPRATDDQS